MITPSQASEAIEVSTSTLRRWSSVFKAFLSPRKAVKRMYTPDDIATFKRIKDLFSQGLTTAQVNEALMLVQPSDNTKALVNIADFSNALMTLREDNFHLSQQVEKLTERLDALEEYYKLPFFKRIGKRPPFT